jgi:hypothetical protein
MIVSAAEDGALCIGDSAPHATGGLRRSQSAQEQCQTEHRGNWDACFAGPGVGTVSESLSGKWAPRTSWLYGGGNGGEVEKP